MPGKEPATGPTATTVAANVKRLREEKNLTYTQLSERLKEVAHWSVSPVGVRRIEDGERRVTVDDLVALALALEVSPLRLLLTTKKGVLVDGGAVYTPEEIWTWAHGERPLTGGYVEAITFLRDSNPVHWPLMEKAVRERGYESVDDVVQKVATEFVDRGYTLAKPTDERERGTDGDD